MGVTPGPYEHLGDELEACRDLAERFIAASKEGASPARAYQELLQRTWHELAQLIGGKGAEAVMRRAIRLASSRVSGLEIIKVNSSGVDLSRIGERPDGASGSTPAWLELFLSVMDLTYSLIGPALARAVAERIAGERG